MNAAEEKFLYCREALKIPHTMNENASIGAFMKEI